MYKYNIKKISPLALISVLILILLFSLTSVCFAAQESITLTTYYPAPYGIYRELRVDQMSVGSGYRNANLTDGMLIVEGRVGIGTPTPTGVLDVDGGENPDVSGENITLKAQDREALMRGDFVGGNILLLPGNYDNAEYSGRVGIGTTDPRATLDIKGRAPSGFEVYGAPETDGVTIYGIDGANNTAIQLVTAGGTPYIDFTNDYINDYDIRLMLTTENNLSILGDGNVGIGTTDPTRKLDIDGMFRQTNGHMLFRDLAHNAVFVINDTADVGFVFRATPDIDAYHPGQEPTFIDLMVIDPAGRNVGIGIDTPNPPQSPAPNDKDGNLDVNDVFVRSFGDNGEWLSDKVGSGQQFIRFDKWVEGRCRGAHGYFLCNDRWIQVAGGHWRQDSGYDQSMIRCVRVDVSNEDIVNPAVLNPNGGCNTNSASSDDPYGP